MTNDDTDYPFAFSVKNINLQSIYEYLSLVFKG